MGKGKSGDGKSGDGKYADLQNHQRASYHPYYRKASYHPYYQRALLVDHHMALAQGYHMDYNKCFLLGKAGPYYRSNLALK
jgi:hypothetical protein